MSYLSWTPRNGVSAFVGRDTRELAVPSAVGGHKKKPSCGRMRNLTRTNHAGSVISKFQPIGPWEYKSLSLELPTFYNILSWHVLFNLVQQQSALLLTKQLYSALGNSSVHVHCQELTSSSALGMVKSSGWESDILMLLDKMCPFVFRVARLVRSKLELTLGKLCHPSGGPAWEES